jgi:type IV secretory pathway VirB10-like protein
MANPFDPTPRPSVVRIRLAVLWFMIILVVAVCVGAYYIISHGGWRNTVSRWVEKDHAAWPAWMKQQVAYQPEPPRMEVNHREPQRDLNAEEIARLKAKLIGIEQTLEVLKNRQPPTPPKPTPPPAQPKRSSMIFVSHELKDEPEKAPNTYTLAPGATKIPCVVETAVNSDVEGSLTAKVNTNIYDTATGHHLLIPQGSTILGHDRSSTLLFGNERLPTIALTLALRDGRSVDLGNAPMTDQQGVAGLTGDVNNHWGRLAGAVFVGGALRGGQQVIQTEIASQGGATPIVGGIAGQANTLAQQRLGRAMDTRPTITVEAGQLCTVLLIKPLRLPAF